MKYLLLLLILLGCERESTKCVKAGGTWRVTNCHDVAITNFYTMDMGGGSTMMIPYTTYVTECTEWCERAPR